MAVPEVISGKLSDVGTLKIVSGRLSGTSTLCGGVSIPTVIHNEYYDGETTVVPSDYDKVLHTNGKTMRDDVTVVAIPFFRTTNVSGGDTIYIGGF